MEKLEISKFNTYKCCSHYNWSDIEHIGHIFFAITEINCTANIDDSQQNQ